jgi:hypothetical protein
MEESRAASGGFLANAASVASGMLAFQAIKGVADDVSEFTSRTFEAAESAENLARSLQIPLDVLQGLQYAGFVKTGMAAEDFDLLLNRFAKDLGEGFAGEGEKAIKALDRLGLSADAIKNMRVDEAFMLIADRISNVKNAYEAAADATDIFGRSGQALLPILSGGSQGLQEMIDKAREVGDAFGDNAAAKMGEALQATREMREAMQGLGNELAISVAPAVKDLAEHLDNMVVSLNRVNDQRDRAYVFFSGLIPLLQSDARDAEILAKEIGSIGQQMEAMKASGSLNFGTVAHPDTSHIEDLRKLLDLQKEEIADAQAMQEKMKSAGMPTDGLAAGIAGMQKDLQNNLALYRQLEDAQRNAAAASAAPPPVGAEAKRLLGESIDPMRKLGEQTRELTDALKNGAIGWGDYFSAMQKALEQVAKPGVEAAERAKREEMRRDIEDQRKWAEEQQKEHDEIKRRQEEMANEAKRIWEETRTPAEKYQEAILHLNELVQDGAVDMDTYARRAKQLRDELERQTDSLKGLKRAQDDMNENRTIVRRNDFFVPESMGQPAGAGGRRWGAQQTTPDQQIPGLRQQPGAVDFLGVPDGAARNVSVQGLNQQADDKNRALFQHMLEALKTISLNTNNVGFNSELIKLKLRDWDKDDVVTIR